MSDTLLLKDVLAGIDSVNSDSTVIPEGFRLSAPFRPVKCVEEDIKHRIEPAHNFIYFTTDTKKIFLGHQDSEGQNSFLPMCSSSGFFYGQKEIEYDHSGTNPDPDVIFLYDEIEGDAVPEIDDLILNKDGCFYRVTAISEYEIETTRLTLQGSGNMGGGDSSTESNPHYSFSLLKTEYIFSSETTEMPINFILSYANLVSPNTIKSISFGLGENNYDNPFYTVQEDFEMNKTHVIDLAPYKHLFGSESKALTISMLDQYETRRYKTFKIKLMRLELENTSDTLLYSDTGNYDYSCKLYGATSKEVLSKSLVYEFYTPQDLETPIYTQTQNVERNKEGSVAASFNKDHISGQYGIYILKVYATAKVSGIIDPLKSNTITHKIGFYNPESTQPMLMVSIADNREQYVDIPLEYVIVHPNASDNYDFGIYVDDVKLTTLAAVSNTIGSYNLYFENTGVYTIACRVPLRGLTYTETVTINKYSGDIPVIDSGDLDLMLYLNPKGKSNSEVNKDRWVSSALPWEGKTPEAKLSNINFSSVNGWNSLEDGTAYLALTSGARLEVANFYPFTKDLTVRQSGSQGRSGRGMSIELDFEINGTLDFDTEVISCISYDSDKKTRAVGFGVTGNRVSFYSKLATGSEGKAPLMSLNLVEGQRTKVSFVIEPRDQECPMAYIYLNGIMSGAVIYDSKNDKFIDGIVPAIFKVDAADASIKLYSVRFYSTALSHREILNNYTASLSSLAERESVYYDNDVFDSFGKIDYDKVVSADRSLQIPYMVIRGGWQTYEESKWQLKKMTDAAQSNNPGLPTGKKDYRLVDVEVHYPDTPLFSGYQDYAFVNKFASGHPMSEQYGNKPINGGAIMYAQGTSSMEYPVKNLRLRFKEEENWYSVRPDIANVEIICMKADYMESSGSHNTGAANFVDSLYTRQSITTPGQEHDWKDDKTIVTCIKGHPCLIFYSESTDPSVTPKYIGKYNLNLDKATPEPFGFNHDESDFGYLSPGDTYYEVQYYDKDKPNEPTWIGQERPSKGGDYYPQQTETEKTVAEGQKINSIHCFEFLDNAVEVCNFLPKARSYIMDEFGNQIPDPAGGFMTFEETWFSVMQKGEDKVPGWALGFESRYPEDRIGIHDADSLYPLASWLNELYRLRYGYNEYFELVNTPNETEALRRFRNEYQRFLNKDFTLAYYLITEALLMVDSRTKNMMIATWGKEDVSYVDVNGQTQTERNYIFYPIFYDMDTMMGLDNIGVHRFNYYDNDKDGNGNIHDTIYNGSEVLWSFVRDALVDELRAYFNDFESSLHEDTILPYFNLNQAYMANQAFYNGDADYKYLTPAREGYFDYLNEKEIDPGMGPYLYALQGDRGLMREWFLTNRMRFLRGKYQSGKFKSGDRAEFRWQYPTSRASLPDNPTTRERMEYSAYVAAKPDGKFGFKSVQTGYAGVQLGVHSPTVHYYEGEEEHTIIVPNASGADGTETYIYGLSNLADLGDLSNKYMQKFILTSPTIRLTKLTLGNPHRYYYNPNWGSVVNGEMPEVNLTNCRYLRHLNFYNCEAYPKGLDLSNCPAIETVLATGSTGLQSVTLPENGMLQELRLPPLNTLTIHSHPNLKKFSMGGYDYDRVHADEIEDENGYYNQFYQISDLDIIDTPIDTYHMVCDSTELLNYNLHGVKWIINQPDTLYLLESNPTAGNVYYTKNSDHSYSVFTGDATNTEELLYRQCKMVDESKKIVCIPVLEKLHNIALDKDNAANNATKHAAALSGEIIISMPGYSLDEYALYEKYRAIYPSINITHSGMSDTDVVAAYQVEFYATETIDDDSRPYWTIKHNGSTTWGAIAYPESGEQLPSPVKDMDAENIWTHNGKWRDADKPSDEYIITPDSTDTAPQKKQSDGPLRLVPVFDNTPRLYTFNFYDDSGSPIFSEQSQYNEKISIADLMRETHPIYYYYKAYDGDKAKHRYALKGWINKQTFDNLDKVTNINERFISLENTKIIQDQELYAYFVEEDATTSATNINCFNINYVTDTALADGRGKIECSGLYIELKPQYAEQLQESITLPSYVINADGSKTPIVGIGGVRGADFNLITNIATPGFSPDAQLRCHTIYCLADNQYQVVHTAAFIGCQSLVAMYLPAGIKEIRPWAFKEAFNLQTVIEGNSLKHSMISYLGDSCFSGSVTTPMQLKLTDLPDVLTHLGKTVFYNAGVGIEFSSLPNGIPELPAYVFYLCKNVFIANIGGPDSNLKTLRTSCLEGCGQGAEQTGKIVEIVIGSSIETIILSFDEPVFANYCANASAITVQGKHYSSILKNGKPSVLADWFDSNLIEGDPAQGIAAKVSWQQ